MPNAIERDVYVLRNTLKNPISYVRGTDLLPIIFHFRDFTIPSGATATAFTAKPDGNAVYGSATISENDVTVDVQQQMFIVLGLSMLQVEIKSGEETLATFVQPVMVEPNLKAGDFPPSTTDINFLDEVIEQSQEAVNNANQAIASANTAIEGANTAASSANQAAENANNTAQELLDKAEAGDFDGPKGDTGDAATVQVGTVQTLQPEENAEVTNSGTANAAVLNFKIPRGEDGMTDLTAEYKDASEYTCQPTVNAPVVVKELDGKTEQVETTGAQLFDASKIPTKSQGGATVTNNGDGSFTISGNGNLTEIFYAGYAYSHEESVKIIKSGILNASFGTNTYPYVAFEIRYADGAVYVNNNKKNIDFKEVTNEVINDPNSNIVIYYSGGKDDAIVPGTIKPMVYQTGDGTWEPYTGGSPAPSPDYPQAIKGVGGMGYFDGNLQKGYYNTSGVYTSADNYICTVNKIECKQSDNINVELETSATSIIVSFFQSSGTFIRQQTASGTSLTATAPANAGYCMISINRASIEPQTAGRICVKVNGKYASGVESHGVNLFDASKLPSKTQGGVTVTNNGDGSFTISGSGTISGDFKQSYSDPNIVNKLKAGNIYLITGKATYPYVEAQFKNSQGAIIKYLTSYSNASPSASFTEEEVSQVTNYEAIIWAAAGQTVTPGTIKPMLYQDGDGTWEPYHHTTLTIPLTSPLYEGDKICYVKPGESYVNAEGDTVVADRMLYGCYRENAEVVFDGSGDENWIHEINNRYRTGLNNSNNIYTENTAKCNFFKYNTNVYSDHGSQIGFIVSGAIFYCRFDSASEINSVSNLRAWLSNNPLTVVYRLAQPYFEPFSDQSIFYGLRTDDTLSYVYSSDPIEPVLTVEAAKNSTGGYLLESYAQAQKNAISEANSQSRISAIEQQLVNQATTPIE